MGSQGPPALRSGLGAARLQSLGNRGCVLAPETGRAVQPGSEPLGKHVSCPCQFAPDGRSQSQSVKRGGSAQGRVEGTPPTSPLSHIPWLNSHSGPLGPSGTEETLPTPANHPRLLGGGGRSGAPLAPWSVPPARSVCSFLSQPVLSSHHLCPRYSELEGGLGVGDVTAQNLTPCHSPGSDTLPSRAQTLLSPQETRGWSESRRAAGNVSNRVVRLPWLPSCWLMDRSGPLTISMFS